MRGNNRHTEERKLQKDFEGQEGMRDIKRMKQRERESERWTSDWTQNCGSVVGK